MRGWINTKDFYKNNGRIRHERVNIEIGHLLNIQIHSYQSKEICNRGNEEENVGGLEHFDIYFFHNPLVDKEPFKEIHIGDMYSDKEKKDFLGYNELSREIFLTNFLNNNYCKGDIKDQALAIEILYACSKGIHNHYSKKKKVEKIDIRNDYTYRFIAKRLKQYSKPFELKAEKQDVKNCIHHKEIYTIYNFLKYIPSKKCYEVCISIDDTKNVVGSLLTKTFNYKWLAIAYYRVLEYVITTKKLLLLKD